MSEEQFWRSNPRIIKVWEQSWKNEVNRQNTMVYGYVGNYVLSALTVGIAQVLTPMFCKGQKSQAKYIEEPVRIFPKTEEEKQAEYEEMTQAFIAWGNAVINKYKS